MSDNTIIGSGAGIASEGGVSSSGKGTMFALLSKAAKKNATGTYSSVQIFDATIKGKTLAKYQRGYLLNLPGVGPWDIKVTRSTADATTANIVNELWWSDYVEIVNAKLNYPNSAMIYTAIDAEQFSSIPSRSFELYGIKCKIPSNYNQATRTYTGFWNGTFVTAWTDNPAWVFYDLITSTRYGLGDVVDEALVDKWTLYSIAQYCDGLVPDGNGGYEPRFTCNLYLQTREDAYKVVANLASIFRGMVFWATGLVTTSQDAPKAIDAIYTAANVIDGSFSYTGTSAKARHNVVLVSWNNPANGYALEIEYIEDAASILVNGIIQTEISAMGCTSQGQAHRLGKWLLYTEQHETETVTFKAGLDGLLCQPGDIIQTQDPFRAGKRLGGRVVSISTVPGVSAAITIDNPILFQVGKTYTALLTSQDGTVVSFALSNTLDNAEQSVLQINTTQTITIQAGSVWLVAVSDLELQSWRVVSVSESSKGILEITGLMYNADKYANIEYNLSLRPRTITSVSIIPPAISDITILEHMYLAGTNRLSNKLSISWVESSGIDTYIINYTKISDNTNPKYITVNIPQVEIEDVSEGAYEIGIVSVNSLGVKSAIVSTIYTVVGKTVNPADILSFNADLSNDAITLSWAPLADLDIDYYEVRYGTWGLDSANTAIYRGTNNVVTLPKIYNSGKTHLFYIKAKDTSGNWSASYTLGGTLIDNTTAKILLTKTPVPSTLPVLVPNSVSNVTNTIALPNTATNAQLLLNGNILKITWSAAPVNSDNISIYGYRIYVLVNGVESLVAEVTTTSYEYLWLDKELSKTFRIETIDNSGQVSIPDLSITKTFTLPNSVTGIISSFSSNKLTLKWTAPVADSTDAATKLYRVYLDSVAIAEVTGTTYEYTWTDKTLSKTFSIETVDIINNTSPKVSTVIPVLVPAAPTGLVSTLTGITLKSTWNHSILASNSLPIAKYVIYFGDVGNPIKIGETVANSYSLEWTYGSTTKAIFIEAVDINGNVSSTRTTITTTIVAPNAPTGLTSVMKESKLLFSWNPATTATNSLPIQYYELREGGANWSTATFIANIPASESVLQYLYGIVNTTELASTPIGTLKYNQAKVFRIASRIVLV